MNKFLLIMVLSVVVFSANIWGTSIYILDEAKNAGCAMEMRMRREWIVPTFNNQLRTDKPPLHYYFMRIAYAAFDVNSFSARIFSSLMGVLTVLSVFLFTKKILDERSAFFSSLILISSVQLAIQFHLAVPDPYLLFFLTTGMLAFACGFIQTRKKYFYLFYVCVSLATLAKGPVAILFAALIVFVFLLVSRSFNVNTFARINLLHGILIFLFLVLPWYVAVGVETKGVWLEQFFFKHNIGRFSSALEGHGGFPFASLVILLAGLMPFSFFFPQMVGLVWKKERGVEKQFLLFCFIAMMVVTLFFTFSKTILPTYPEPAFPFFAILLGYYFSHATEKRHSWISALVFLLIAWSLPFVLYYVLLNDKAVHGLSFLSIYCCILTAGSSVAFYFMLKQKMQLGFYTYVVSQILFVLVFCYVMFPRVDSINPVRTSLHLLTDSDTPLYHYRDFNPAYVMALKKTVPELDSANKERNIYVISQKKYLDELTRQGFTCVFEGQDLFEKPVTIVVKR